MVGRQQRGGRVCDTCGPLPAMSLMTGLAFPQFSARAPSPAGSPTPTFPTVCSESTCPSPGSLQGLEPWASLWGTRLFDCPTFWSATGPAASSSEMSLEPRTPVDRCLPRGCPLLVPGGSGWRRSGLHSSPSSPYWAQRPEGSFQTMTLCMSPPRSKVSNYCLVGTVSTLAWHSVLPTAGQPPLLNRSPSAVCSWHQPDQSAHCGGFWW